MFPRVSFSAENTPSLSFRGRIHADRTFFENDKYSYQDGSELRRGRLYIRGNLDEGWEYRIQYDFAPDNPELKDGYIRYNGFRNTRITFGHFKQFSSLEELTSSNNITFTERALPNDLTTSRRIGVGLQRWSATLVCNVGLSDTASPLPSIVMRLITLVRERDWRLEWSIVRKLEMDNFFI